MKIYLAAPLFSLAERKFNVGLAAWLRLDHDDIEVILPQEENVVHFETPEPDWQGVYQTCIEGVERADVVVAVLDGADADSGTCFEAGYAIAKGTPVIGVRTDVRGSELHGVNAMLAIGATILVHEPAVLTDLAKLAPRIVAACFEVCPVQTSALSD